MMSSPEGINHLLNGLKWKGKAGYDAAKWKYFYSDGKNKGIYKSYNNLFFLMATDAGHRLDMD